MRLDNIRKDRTTTIQSKKVTRTNEGNSLVDLINPLMSININSDLHSFYNYREIEKSVKELLNAQSNLVFYAIHQNFMVDEEHKVFFKNLIGRFYDVPTYLWGYYSGQYLVRDGNDNCAIKGLVLLENYHLYHKMLSGINDIRTYKFYVSDINEFIAVEQMRFNKCALQEYWSGVLGNYTTSSYFLPVNRTIDRDDYCISSKSSHIVFSNIFEFGRTQSSSFQVSARYVGSNESNPWFIATWEWLENTTVSASSILCSKAVYASLGIQNMDRIIEILRSKDKINFKESWIPELSKKDEMLIRSLSQTFEWSKQYIYDNQDLLNLEVLALNMSLPWDFELVRFFIKKGYGSRLSENKAVFDKIFQPILTDTILEKLFKCEYNNYLTQKQ